MYKIFNECLYHNRQLGKWTQFFILVVFFNDRKYTFNVSVVRYITYSTNKPDERYISYYRGDNDRVCQVTKDLVKKYSGRLKFYKIISKMENRINVEYERLKIKIGKILILYKIKLPIVLITNYILPHLY